MSDTKIHLIIWPVLLLLGISMFGILYGIHSMVGDMGPRMYNCALAEISPDFTPKMRDECRQLKAKQ
jgi:hypothetical protein